MDKSSSLLQSTTAKIGQMIQGEGGVRHMLVLIVFAFVLVRERATHAASSQLLEGDACWLDWNEDGVLTCCCC